MSNLTNKTKKIYIILQARNINNKHIKAQSLFKSKYKT